MRTHAHTHTRSRSTSPLILRSAEVRHARAQSDEAAAVSSSSSTHARPRSGSGGVGGGGGGVGGSVVSGLGHGRSRPRRASAASTSSTSTTLSAASAASPSFGVSGSASMFPRREWERKARDPRPAALLLSRAATAPSPRSPRSPRFRPRGVCAAVRPRSPRRVLVLALGTLLVVCLVYLHGGLGLGISALADLDLADSLPRLGWWPSTSPPRAPEQCAFMSPLAAYARDLASLRAYARTHNLTTDTARRKGHSFFSPTGHVVLTDAEAGVHPIPALLALGEQRWADLLARQSRTLRAAVAEYKRRNGRNPPRGFDKWWHYARRHNLVLPDEYDGIARDLAPFWALPRDEMRRRLEWVQGMPEVFVLHVADGEVQIEVDERGLEWDGTLPRAEDAAGLLQGFAEHLPDLNATFSIFDQPQIYLSWARRASLVDMGGRGEHTKHLTETDDGHVRLSRSCSPDSNFRRNPSFYEGKSFVHDVAEASDFCLNPYLVPLHGLTIEPHEPTSHPRPHTALLPLFSLTKTAINSDILTTPLQQFYDTTGPDPDWEDKTDPRLAWRGSPTGISMMTRDIPWRNSHRVRLHHFANNKSTEEMQYLVPDLGVDVGRSPAEGVDSIDDAHGNDDDAHTAQTPRLNYKTERAPVEEAMEFFFDIKLTGEPLQCDEEDGTCADMEREIKFARFQTNDKLNKHKFLLDIDGNGWSGRFRRLMSTKSVVVKTGIFTEWFQPHLIPWFMYIPAKLDFSDLADIMAFFTGTPESPWLAFDETAKALGHNGQCFAQRMFRYEDAQAYMMRLFLEFARLAADEGVDMDFYYDEAVHGGEDVDEGDEGEDGDEDGDEDVEDDGGVVAGGSGGLGDGTPANDHGDGENVPAEVTADTNVPAIPTPPHAPPQDPPQTAEDVDAGPSPAESVAPASTVALEPASDEHPEAGIDDEGHDESQDDEQDEAQEHEEAHHEHGDTNDHGGAMRGDGQDRVPDEGQDQDPDEGQVRDDDDHEDA